MVIHYEEALYQMYAPLPLPLPFTVVGILKFPAGRCTSSIHLDTLINIPINKLNENIERFKKKICVEKLELHSVERTI